MSKLIIFEGADGCGKTTAIEIAKRKLESIGASVKVFSILRCTEQGQLFTKTYTETQMDPVTQIAGLIYSIALARDTVIRPALAQCDVVLLDRGWQSLYAYQIQANGSKMGLQLWAAAKAAGFSEQDINVYLECDPRIALSRILKNRSTLDAIEEKGIVYQNRVRAGYEECFDTYPHLAPHKRLDTGVLSPEQLKLCIDLTFEDLLY